MNLRLSRACAFATLIALAPLAHAAGNDCDARAAEKKLAGAAKTSFLKKCQADTTRETKASCDAKAAEKKLAGAAKNSFTKKCVADTQKAA